MFRIVDVMSSNVNSQPLKLVFCTNSYSGGRAVRIMSLKLPSVICSPIYTDDSDQSPCDIGTRPGIVHAVVQLLPSGVAAGVVRLLESLPSLLSVSKSFTRCPPSVARHYHCGSPARSQEEHEVEGGVVAHALGQIAVPSRGRLLLPHEDVIDIRG